MGLLYSLFFYKNNEEDETNNLFQYEKYSNLYFLSSTNLSINSNSSILISQTNENINDNYNQVDILERNINSKIIHIIHKKTRMNKVLKTTTIKNQEYYQDCLNEIETLKNLDHPNIIKIYEYQIKENKSIDIVIEYIKGPNLFSKLSQINHFNEKDTLIIMYQLFSCIKMIHDNGIIHRDIKPENILFKNEKNLFIKLIDYGSCEIFTELKQRSNRRIGTPSYVSPEIINGDNYSYECDIWALGVLMYFILSGKMPFDGVSANDIFNSIKYDKLSFDDNIWSDISVDAKNLIKCLLIKNPNKRININQVLNSPWVVNGLIKYNIKNNLHNDNFCKNILKNNLIKFFEAKINQLQLLYLFYIVHNYIDLYNNNEIELITNEFKYYDTDNDGRLSENEFNNLLNDIGIDIDNRQTYINKYFELFGDNKGKFLFYECFIIMTLSNKKRILGNMQIIQNFFKFITKKELNFSNIKDVNINVNDIENIFFGKNNNNYNKEKMIQLIDNIGINDNETINYERFKASLNELNI